MSEVLADIEQVRHSVALCKRLAKLIDLAAMPPAERSQALAELITAAGEAAEVSRTIDNLAAELAVTRE